MVKDKGIMKVDEQISRLERDKKDLDSIISGLEGEMSGDTGTKRAIDTLHPKDDPEHKDRLTVLTPHEVSAHSVVEWQVKALKTEDFTKEFIIEGLSDKIKALKVSMGGAGRHEVSNIFKPEILGEMVKGGLIPPMLMQQGSAVPQARRGFLHGLFNKRQF